MADTLRAAAQAVVDRWDTPLWKDVPATAEYIGRLRAALVAPEADTNTAERITDEMVHAALKAKNPILYRDHLRHPYNGPVLSASTENEIQVTRKMLEAAFQAGRASLAASAGSEPVAPYSIDADPQGIRAIVADAITGALAFGAQGVNQPPEGHWLAPFWKAAMEDKEAARVKRDLRHELQQLCSTWGAYWRGSDAHGVVLSHPQAVELLQNALGVEVEIEIRGCQTCDYTGVIGDVPRPGCTHPSPPEGMAGWRQGVEAVAAMLTKKADDFAKEHGHDDMGGLSFGRGAHADAHLDYHSGLLELADEVREMRSEATPELSSGNRVLMEHSGCGLGTQIDTLTVRLNPGDKVILCPGPVTRASITAPPLPASEAKEL